MADASTPDNATAATVMGVRNAVGDIRRSAGAAPLSLADLIRELDAIYPGAVEFSDSTLGYVWRFIDGEWQLVCNFDEYLSVTLESQSVAVHLHTEMII